MIDMFRKRISQKSSEDIRNFTVHISELAYRIYKAIDDNDRECSKEFIEESKFVTNLELTKLYIIDMK